MLSPAEYRAIAKSAFEMADDYRRAAEENPNQRAHLLRLADDREENAWFYLDQFKSKALDCQEACVSWQK